MKLFIRSLQFSKNWAKLLLKAFLWTDEQERTKNGPEKKTKKKTTLFKYQNCYLITLGSGKVHCFLYLCFLKWTFGLNTKEDVTLRIISGSESIYDYRVVGD